MIREILTPAKFVETKLLTMQTIVYSIYAHDGEIPPIGLHDPTKDSVVTYLVASSDIPIPSRDLDSRSPHRQHVKELQPFNHVHGFLHTEVGATTEATKLIKGVVWPEKQVYVGGLTIHPYLPRAEKEETQKFLWDQIMQVYSDIAIFLITTPKVLEFARTTGLNFTPVAGSSINRRSKTYQDLKREFPKYWLYGDPGLINVSMK